MKTYMIEQKEGRSIKVPKATRDKIIKDYLIKSYHWTLGISAFIIGIFVGVLIK
jgi:hypothetical protein